MSQLEKEIEDKLRRTVADRGGACLKWVCPGWAGVPDRIVLLPGGRVVFVELKQRGGRLSAMQKWWMKRLTAMGFEHFLIWDNDDLELFKAVYLTK